MKRYLINILYNLDRTIASLFGASSPQETISSELGEHAATNEAAKLGAEALDKIQPQHSENAVKHAEALMKADDGHEK